MNIMMLKHYVHRSKKSPSVLSFLMALLVCFVPIAVSFPENAEAATTLKTYPAPAGIQMNTTYTVQVRESGGTWQTLDVYNTRVSGYQTVDSSLAYFDTDGPVDVSVTYNSGTVTSAAIHPTSAGITPAVNGNTLTFSISGPTKLSVEVNGDVNNNLHLFANPLEVNPPSSTDPNVIYLGPGVYNQDYTVPSGKTLYIAGGAVVTGSVSLNNAVNAKVLGRGILNRPSWGALMVNNANGITIDGYHFEQLRRC